MHQFLKGISIVYMYFFQFFREKILGWEDADFFPFFDERPWPSNAFMQWSDQAGTLGHGWKVFAVHWTEDFLPLESTRVAGKHVETLKFSLYEIHIYIYKYYLYIYIYYLALQIPFYSKVNFFLTHTPMAVQRDTFAMSQATTTCPTTTTPMPAMLLASNKNMVMFLF